MTLTQAIENAQKEITEKAAQGFPATALTERLTYERHVQNWLSDALTPLLRESPETESLERILRALGFLNF